MFMVTPAPFVFLTGQPQKKDISPNRDKIQIKPLKDASFVDLSPSAPPVTNVPSVVESIPVGARMQNFLQVLAAKGWSQLHSFRHIKRFLTDEASVLVASSSW